MCLPKSDSVMQVVWGKLWGTPHSPFKASSSRCWSLLAEPSTGSLLLEPPHWKSITLLTVAPPSTGAVIQWLFNVGALIPGSLNSTWDTEEPPQLQSNSVPASWPSLSLYPIPLPLVPGTLHSEHIAYQALFPREPNLLQLSQQWPVAIGPSYMTVKTPTKRERDKWVMVQGSWAIVKTFTCDELGWDGTVYLARCLVTNIGEIVTLRIVESSGNC